MTGVVTFEFVGAIVSALVMSIAVVSWVFKRFARSDREMSDLKLHVAEKYATKSGLTESLNRMHDSLDRLTGRFDELMRRMSDRSE